MYDEHFGLTGRPFQLTPDPAFWYETATHRRAMAYLGYGLAQGEGFIVITGDIGAGKTTLVGHLLATLDREALNPIKIVSTQIEASDLLRLVAGQLGVETVGLEKAQLLVAIERGLHAVARSGRRTLLIVDEAQALPTGAVEELRMLSNFQAGGHALLQIVLLGQPEFRAALHGSARLEQLRQRVIAIHHLDPMGADEVAAYVRHRLAVVGWSGRPGFADSAFAALHRLTDGVPRRLNQLCNRVMLHAAVEGIDLVTAATVDTVAADLFADLPTHGRPAGDLPAAAEVLAPLPSPMAPPTPLPTPAAAGAQRSGFEDEASAPASIVSQGPDLRQAGEEVAADHLPPSGLVAPAPARPFRHSWLTAPEAAVVEPAAAEVADPSIAETIETASEPVTAAAAPALADADIADRLAALEARLEEQDVALRRVLTLLVDWVEGDAAAKPAAGPDTEPHGYVPIRGAAA